MKSSELGKKVIKKELPLIPKSPGIYRMINYKGDVHYIGKAKNLPNRLRSYVSEKNQKVKFSLEIDYRDKKPSNDKDLKSIVNYANIVKLKN